MELFDKWKHRFFKLINKKTTVYLYALCWNDEKMLPHFFNHYDDIVDKYFIFDHDSTDRSKEIILKNPKAVLKTFEVTGNSFVQTAADLYNRIWKENRHQADWIIICNVDEFFFHPEGFQNYLKKCYYEQYTLIQPEGYEMVADDFPGDYSKKIYETVRFGCRSNAMDKAQIFNPKKIKEINFAVGRHSNKAEGKINIATGAKLLHFKYIGIHYWLPRQNELKQGLKELDIQNRWGEQYLWEDAEKIRIAKELSEKAEKIV